MQDKMTFSAGFARVDITPPLGVRLMGYFVERLADGILDPLELTCVAIREGGKLALIITADNCGMQKPYIELAKDAIIEAVAVDREGIFIHATHTHNGPKLCFDDALHGEIDILHAKYVLTKFAQVAKLAIDDLQEASLGYGVSRAERIGFNRRYLMKDGTVQTNPGINNPEIDKPIGLVDDSVGVLRIDRTDKSSIVIINYANHPDTIGGNKVSGDWPALARRTFERAVPGSHCMVINGCQGDVNHVNAMPSPGYMNGMKIDFDSVPRGYTHAIHMGNVVAGAAMQVYEKVAYIDAPKLSVLQREIEILHNKPTAEELPQAKRILKHHEEGNDALLPYKGMMLTTMVADAARKVRLADAPDTLKTIISIIRIGEVALVGLPGEPFTGVGIALKDTEGYGLILPACNTNTKEGYFPMQSSYDEGGYEAVTSPFRAGCAEYLIDIAQKYLKELLS